MQNTQQEMQEKPIGSILYYSKKLKMAFALTAIPAML